MNKRMHKSWFNFRPLLLIFVFLMLGSLFGFFVTKHLVLSIIVLALIMSLTLVVAIINKKPKFFIIPVVSFLIAFSFFNFACLKFDRNLDIPETVSARIYSVDVKEKSCLVKADNCKIDGVKVSAYIYIYDTSGLYEGIEIGRKIEFNPKKAYKSDLNYGDVPNARMYKENLRMSFTVDIDNVKIGKLDKTFAEEIKSYVKTKLQDGLTTENVEIAYSALFGDKEFLNDNQYNAYRISGIAHLLAVSGLHVGIITSILYFILDRIRFKGWKRLFLVSAFLFVYAYICGFAVSVVRAMIMAIVLMLSKIFKEDYDTLSSISIAGIIIFLFNPLCVFDIGFQMSFACVFGIALFSTPIKNALMSIKFPEQVATAFAISLSTMIALMIIMAYYFKTLNIISLIANILLIPIFTIGFSIVFVISMLSFIPNICVVLYPVNYIFDFINVVAIALGSLPFANMRTIGIHFLGIIVYFVILFILSSICLAKPLNKAIISISLLAILVLLLV
ncbi:MAG: ComEC/Rec2 family competence protein [Clostridiales bacterium]|nr:ComEC/Rec2 family competence protein [Clostridiales bacterium]